MYLLLGLFRRISKLPLFVFHTSETTASVSTDLMFLITVRFNRQGSHSPRELDILAVFRESHHLQACQNSLRCP